ncbi:hypothetical protein SAMN05660909_02600 [Chitinophaga terrae (ex Kim and Jung 2007)]|uniref:Uncharacterized protein n=1 Tax=Chitinophaga terrae (ex Kim and Jung 2007) TaxID=408074 RepID=A0A1H4CFZ8_9BACT|nr:hypothetical protein [Chitinophaga terrae (ex Kim and Jung 2007)]MDQ0110573.1 hypothetical protein [Chitinophaga terrae (ex Kim and Jung 2007)]SEA59002.1 hypothetical protein SAMN05660909_02600 [Chitinophaga terrae (ex Kim and Jung 2007)]
MKFSRNIILLVFLLMNANGAIAQRVHESKARLSRTDSIIIRYLLVNNQFPDLSANDTSNLTSERNNIIKRAISVKRASGKYIEVIGFGSNVSHSHNYILFVNNSSYKIIGSEDLENNILEMNRYLKESNIKLTNNERLICYDILIMNSSQREEGPKLMNDDMPN